MKKNMDALYRGVEFFLPEEILFEILSRLTVAFLTRCKCVCKRWNEIIQHPKFIEMHMSRSRVKALYLTNETSNIFHSRYGLLMEKSKSSGKYLVRNPTTKQILKLPDPVEKPISVRIVFIESTSSYKLVYIYEMKGDITSIGFKVLNFEGSDLLWRNIDYSISCELDRKSQKTSIVLIGKFLYFSTLCVDGSSDSVIHCLNVETEIFRGGPISVPRSLFSLCDEAMVGQWEGKFIAVLNIVDSDLHAWVLEDPIKGKWAEEKIKIPLTFLKQNLSMKKTLIPSWASHEKIWFTKKDGGSISYNTRSKQAGQVRVYTHPEKKIIFSGICTLVKLKGMQPAKEASSDYVIEDTSAMSFELVK